MATRFSLNDAGHPYRYGRWELGRPVADRRADEGVELHDRQPTIDRVRLTATRNP